MEPKKADSLQQRNATVTHQAPNPDAHASPGFDEPGRGTRAWAEGVLLERGDALRALGGSMMPFIWPGREVRFSSRAPRIGEVAIYRGPDQRVRAHRVLAHRPGAYIIRGDRLGLRLERVPASSMLGTWEASGLRDWPLIPWPGRVVGAASLLLNREGMVGAIRGLRGRLRGRVRRA